MTESQLPEILTGVGIALDLIAFVFLALRESRDAGAESKLEEFEDYITGLEAIASVPVEPLPATITAEHRQFNEMAIIVRGAELQALKENKQRYLATKAQVREASERRKWRTRVALGMIGLGSLFQIIAVVMEVGPRQAVEARDN